MKASMFNSFFSNTGTPVGYNSFTNEFIFPTDALYKLYMSAAANDINAIAAENPDFWQTLVGKGFVVANETDELQQVKDRVHFVDYNTDRYRLFIIPTLNCNFSCWYCYEMHIKGSKMNEATVEKVKKHISNVSNDEKIKYFSLSWFGGEPLLYYKRVVAPIMEFTGSLLAGKNIKFQCDFTTNGFLLNDKIIRELAGTGAKTSLQITLDGVRNRHNQVRFTANKSETYDIIVGNIKKCLKAGLKVLCRINISKDTLIDIEKIKNEFDDLSLKEREHFNFTLHRVWQEKENLDETISKLNNLFRIHNFAVNNMIDGKDMVKNSCYADRLNQAIINYNGDVFKCTSRNYESENREGILLSDGTIEWNEKRQARMNSKFKNPPCLTCNILPICNGLCSQRALENAGTDYCFFKFDENKKIDFVRPRMYEAIAKSAVSG